MRSSTPGRRAAPSRTRTAACALLSETASARLATPVEVAAGELERADGLDLRSPSARFPAPLAGRPLALADVVDTQLAASLAILEHAASHREHWLRTALAANRRAARAASRTRS